MAKIFCLLALCLATVLGSPTQSRIAGGSVVSISTYPFLVALLHKYEGFEIYHQACGGSIINNRSVLTAAHCLEVTGKVGIRAGSSLASFGGTIYEAMQLISHPNYEINVDYDDIAIVRIWSQFSFGPNVQVGRIAGPEYLIGDNEALWAAGWGATETSLSSEVLQHVQIFKVNQTTCQSRYNGIFNITENMLCAGARTDENIGVCNRDSGGPLMHNGVVVGIVNFGIHCGRPEFPGVFARVSKYTDWIRSNA